MDVHLSFVNTLLVILATVTGSTGLRGGTNARNDADNLRVQLQTTGSYAIQVRKMTWLYSAPTFFNSGGATYTAFKDLKLNKTFASSGQDAFGAFQTLSFRYVAGRDIVVASIKTYEAQPFVIFSQRYESGGHNTSLQPLDVDSTVSGFPAFYVTKIYSRRGPIGYLGYGGPMCGDKEKRFGVFSQDDLRLTTGIAGGPLALFDGTGDTLILSPASHFMAASIAASTGRYTASSIHWGIMGGVDRVPAGETIDFVLFYSSGGVNQAFEDWGRHLRQLYQRTDHFVRNDVTLNYLGYWTDNGGYYYYHTEHNRTYEETVVDVKKYADTLAIPYRYWQFDSWWYYKGRDEGVTSWTARPDVFPHGFPAVYRQLGKEPVAAHNRYWSSQTPYARHNGGSYNFIVEHNVAVPSDQRFWDDLFSNASAWGLHMYEQDWLCTELSRSKALLSDLTLGSEWLGQMARAASGHGVPVQYCMAFPRHALHALTTSVVTQVRVSNDYHPGSDQWKIGVSSILAHALGIAPFKDTFWTTERQPFNKYNGTEPNSELQALVSVLSTGPVGPSDMVGHTNVSLLARCCNAEGLILKPSKPATAIDDQIYEMSMGPGLGPDGEVWATFTNVSTLLFGIVVTPVLNRTYNITPSAAGFRQTDRPLVVYPAGDVGRVTPFADHAPLTLSGCCPARPCVHHAVPVLRQRPTVLFFGELSKFVPVSPQRVTSIDVGDDVIVQLRGAPKEVSYMTFSVDGRLKRVKCVFGRSRTAVLRLNSATCR